MDFPKYVVNDAYLNYCSKTTHYAQNYLFDCFIVFLSCYSIKILPAKPLDCSSLNFVCVSMGHAHFPNDEIRIPWRSMRPSTLFFGSRTSTRKAGFEVCRWSLRLVFFSFFFFVKRTSRTYPQHKKSTCWTTT